MGALSQALAVRTLQLELEYIAGALEDEALDIGQGTQNPTFLLSRQVRRARQPCAAAKGFAGRTPACGMHLQWGKAILVFEQSRGGRICEFLTSCANSGLGTGNKQV